MNISPNDITKDWEALTDQERLETALRRVFDAYDLDETGSISAKDFLKLEIRHGFELGNIGRVFSALPQLTRADKTKSGQISFADFCECRLRAYQTGKGLKWVPSLCSLAQCALDEASRTVAERERMGPRYHLGIRRALKEMFRMSNVRGTDELSASEWILTRAFLMQQGDAVVVDRWLSEDSFNKADVGARGFVQRSHFLDLSSYVLEEKYVRDCPAALQDLESLNQRLQERSEREKTLSAPVIVYGQNLAHPDFQPPTMARRSDNFASFSRLGDVLIPGTLTKSDDLLALLRTHAGLSSRTCFSVFFRRSTARSDDPPILIVTVTDIISMRDAVMADSSGQHTIYIKNFRFQPQDLEEHFPMNLEGCPLEERVDRTLTGRRYALDWETQLLGTGCTLPIFAPLTLGDVFCIRVPECRMHGIHVSVHMSRQAVFSSPYIEECSVTNKEADTSKPESRLLSSRSTVSKPSARQSTVSKPGGPPPSKTGRGRGRQTEKALGAHIYFAALREGRCRFFIEVTWEHLEAEVAQSARSNDAQCPAAEASVGRVGPFYLDVRRQEPTSPRVLGGSEGERSSWLWWNGLKWSAKRGRVLALKRNLTKMDFGDRNVVALASNISLTEKRGPSTSSRLLISKETSRSRGGSKSSVGGRSPRGSKQRADGPPSPMSKEIEAVYKSLESPEAVTKQDIAPDSSKARERLTMTGLRTGSEALQTVDDSLQPQAVLAGTVAAGSQGRPGEGHPSLVAHSETLKLEGDHATCAPEPPVASPSPPQSKRSQSASSGRPQTAGPGRWAARPASASTVYTLDDASSDLDNEVHVDDDLAQPGDKPPLSQQPNRPKSAGPVRSRPSSKAAPEAESQDLVSPATEPAVTSPSSPPPSKRPGRPQSAGPGRWAGRPASASTVQTLADEYSDTDEQDIEYVPTSPLGKRPESAGLKRPPRPGSASTATGGGSPEPLPSSRGETPEPWPPLPKSKRPASARAGKQRPASAGRPSSARKPMAAAASKRPNTADGGARRAAAAKAG